MVRQSHERTTRSQIEAAAQALNAIRLTIGQLERGFNAWLKGGSAQDLKAGRFAEYQQARVAALLAFANREGLAPAERAAEAIMLRYSPVIDALAEGINLKISDPEGYRALATNPITEEMVFRFMEEDQRGDGHSRRRIIYPLNDNPP